MKFCAKKAESKESGARTCFSFAPFVIVLNSGPNHVQIFLWNDKRKQDENIDDSGLKKYVKLNEQGYFIKIGQEVTIY